MHLEIFAIIFILNFLRRSVQVSGVDPALAKNLRTAMIVACITAVMLLFANQIRVPALWLCYGVLAWLTYQILNNPVYGVAKPTLFSVLPYVAISLLAELVKLVSDSLFHSLFAYFETGKWFAILWALAMWIISSRQRKALDREKKKTHDIENEIKITERIKVQLEIQVAERTAALTKQKEELQHALDELTNTQKQLLHAEKMASLGELTAGIAHEIQNPLNFVTNFSEVSNELIEELQAERHKGQRDEQLEDDLLNDIKENLEKINHHGKRADAIVKGMLQHSRKSTGLKEPVAINALADEYLRLSYHGLRAKDKSFNAAMRTDFDATIGEINVVPEDVGRVLLNLYNNAFYAVAEKKKQAQLEAPATATYQPTISVTTKKMGDKIEIKVADNGNGIPQSVIDKIFQPFFTTKPTGQGTGLGLSLSYDIIKAHGGEIKVETKEGEGTEFLISLPLKEKS